MLDAPPSSVMVRARNRTRSAIGHAYAFQICHIDSFICVNINPTIGISGVTNVKIQVISTNNAVGGPT